MSATDSPLPSDAYTSLLKIILRHYLPASIPDPVKVDPATADKDGVSVRMLEQCYLPFAANSTAADINARMSLVLENLFRKIWDLGGIKWTSKLQKAVEQGIEARSARTKTRKNARPKGDGDNDDETARDILDDSSRRLLTMMSILKLST